MVIDKIRQECQNDDYGSLFITNMLSRRINNNKEDKDLSNEKNSNNNYNLHNRS